MVADKTNDKVADVYSEVKAGEITVDQVLGATYVNCDTYKYFDGVDIQNISQQDLDKLVAIKQQYQKASPSGNYSFKKLYKKADEIGIEVHHSLGLLDLLEIREKELSETPMLDSYNPELHNTTTQAMQQEIGDLGLKKRNVQNQYRELNKLKRKIQDRLLFRSELLNTISNGVELSESFPLPNPHPETTDTELFVVMSDWHIGAKVDWSKNQYNYEIAQKLVQNYFNRVISYINLYNPKTVYLVNLGDMIEGSYMRANQTYTIEFTMGEQQRKAIQLVTQFVTSIREANAKIVYTGIGGNHDRYGGNKKENVYGDSFATVLNGVMESLANNKLSTGEEDTNFIYLEPDTIYRTAIESNGNKLLFVHGDNDDLANNNILGVSSQFNNTIYKAIIGGHKHSAMIKETGNGWVVQAGSLIGGTEYSDQLKLGASRSQQIIVSTPDGMIIPNIVRVD